MKNLNLILAVFLTGAAQAAPLRSVAVLPFIPQDRSDPREGWSISVKLASKMQGRAAARALSWAELGRLMDESGLDKSRLREPAVIREIGRRLGVDEVIIGGFAARGGSAVAQARLVAVSSGKVSKSPEWKVERDVLVRPPEFSVEPPVLDEDEPGMRDSVSDNPCDGARGRVDALEESILDLKARYWALQLQRGVGMSAIKFNPGSTITDPDLKKNFYRRIKEWMKENVVPELAPAELKQFGEVDEQAIALARACRIL